MQIRTDFLATRGATQRECAQPCNLPSSLGSLRKECTGDMHSRCLATELKQPHLGEGGKGRLFRLRKQSKVETYKNHQVPFQGYISITPQPRLPFEFLGQGVMKHRLSPKHDLELLNSCLHQVQGFWNAPQNRKQNFVHGRQAPHQAHQAPALK